MSGHTGAYHLRPSLLASLSKSSFGFGSLDQVSHLLFMTIQFLGPYLYRSVIILSVRVGAAPISSVIILSVWFGAAPISIGHLLVMTVQFLGPHLYQSVIHHVSLSRGRTYIDRPSSCQFESGPHLYRSVIRRVSLSRGRIYIDRPSPCHVSSSSVWVGVVTISIGHFPISLCLV